ncbi:ABC transporter ATP-binding protein [Virgibacillus byunsanensis]|uniref:ABC transporter ATP-binding protein n=1 Tax=Virgibacillus byunsanensis TaxID=570945 RepID=A0ABW3LQI1_9BACI
MLNVRSISHSYSTKSVFKNVSFSVSNGEIVGLVGENGAGKSTLLKTLATLTNPVEGEIMLHDQPYHQQKKDIRKKIGFVPQDIALWEEFTVEENMIFFEKLSWVTKNKEDLKQICQDMNLDKWNEPVKSLSGGMKRKLNLAISLIHDPQVLLLDEPTAGIDLKSRKEIGSYLYKKAKNENKLIIYTSHDMDEIITLCDRVYCLGKDPFYEQLLEKAEKELIVL